LLQNKSTETKEAGRMYTPHGPSHGDQRKFQQSELGAGQIEQRAGSSGMSRFERRFNNVITHDYIIVIQSVAIKKNGVLKLLGPLLLDC